MKNHREIAYAMLRVTLGIMFLFYGVGKFQGGIGNFAAGMEKQFAGKLPALLLSPFAHLLPFAEALIGALLVLGLFNVLALVLAGLLMIALTFGAVIMGSPPTAAQNISFGLVVFVLLWTAESNGFSVDRLRRSQHP